MRPLVIHRSTVLASTCTASASLSGVWPRSSRSARSRSLRISPCQRDVTGRLHPSGDVLTNPAAVLARSNRVLTLRRILRCMTAKSAALVALAPAFPLAPTGPTLAYARDADAPVSPHPARATPGQDRSGA